MRKCIRTVIPGLLLILNLTGSAAALAAERCTIAWSHYTGWEPIQYMKDSGILAKWGKRYGVELDITSPMDYVESINQYTAKQFCAIAVTNMDALTIPAVGGIDTTFIVIGDYSNGNDGILAKATKPMGLKDITGREVKLVEYTVSHYLLARAFQINGLKLASVKTVNTSDSDIGALFATGGQDTVIVTWNPILMTARKVKGAQLLFDSSKIPGEIIDGIAVQTEVSDNVKKAIVGAWFEVTGIMVQRNSPRQRAAIAQMAKSAGGSEADFKAQLKTTALFFNAADAVKFTQGAQLKNTMNFVRTFIFERGLLRNAKSADVIGIQFPDGTVLGDAKHIRLRFDTKYMEMAAAGTLAKK
ncbi:MAG TPA: putative urea ABC transporter substrate-binding protein [Thermoanaerobaculia bacterium]|jgi:NitT/TauT family transport system substrate-binding protein|nr:putative urea ABC transporter substrate-binding protein [Thermoanaerobaculia bacterium]